MSNPLSDFPGDHFNIVAFCDYGHSAALDLSALPPKMTTDQLQTRLRCRECGSREVSLGIIWHDGVAFPHDWGGRASQGV
jgi:hypothetical protein